jgi:hypothetical protein
MSSRHPAAIWQRLVDETGEEAIEAAVSVSVARAERDLVAAGFDVAAERAVAVAQIDELASGRVVELVPLDEVLARGGDYLDDKERAELHRALTESMAEADAGHLTDVDDVLAEIRAAR